MLLPGDTDHHAQWVAECCPALEREGGAPGLLHPLVIPCEGRQAQIHTGSLLPRRWGFVNGWKVQRERQSLVRHLGASDSASSTVGFSKAKSGAGMATVCDRRKGGALHPLCSPARCCCRDVKWVSAALALGKLSGPLSAPPLALPAIGQGREGRDRFCWSPGKFAMLTALPQNQGGAAQLSSRLPPSGDGQAL